MARHEVQFGIRAPRVLRNMIDLAADQRGVSASEWTRRVLKREAVAELTGEREDDEAYSRERARTRGSGDS